VLVIAVEFAAAFGVAGPDPVGGLVAGAGELVGVDEGFQQDGGVAVAVLPVGGQLAGGAGEDRRGEVADVDVRQDEEPGVAGDQVQVGLAGGRVPADVGVAGRAGPGGGAEAERCDRVLAGVDEVADLGAGQRGVAEVVVVADQSGCA
jgi:hypothetical protein